MKDIEYKSQYSTINILYNLTNLSLTDNDYINLTYLDLNIIDIPNNLIINQYYEQIGIINDLLEKGTIFNNKLMIIGLLRLEILLDKVINIIKLNNSKRQTDIARYHLDKFTPNYFLTILQLNLSNEHYKFIKKNYLHYLSIFIIDK